MTDDERTRLADAFAAHGALQCGFCTPGIVMRTIALLGRDKETTRDDAARHLGAHLCRCTGYVKILDAVEALANQETPVAITAGGVGGRSVKYEGHELTLGDRDFIDDLEPDGCLHGAVVLSDHARADVVSIDTAAAEALEIGLATRVVSNDALDAEVGTLCAQLASFSPGALRMGKEAIYNSCEMEERAALAYLRETIVLTSRSEDAQEGIRAFFEKREPVWRGR